MEKKVTITATENGNYSLESLNMPVLELIGVLRFFEEKIRHDMYNKSTAKSNLDDKELNYETFNKTYEAAKRLVIEKGYCSTEIIKAFLAVGDNMAGMIIDKLEEDKIVEPFTGSKKRKLFKQ